MNRVSSRPFVLASLILGTAVGAAAQRPGGGGPGGGFPGGGETKLVVDHDTDGNGWLNAAERAEALITLKAQQAEQAEQAEQSGRGRRRRRGGFGRGEQEPAKAGPSVAVADAPTYAGADLYDTATLRTFFLEFEGDDWESELAAFKSTDVEVPATLTVDGETYDGVGVSFRGMSSFMMVPAGFKRSFNLSMDFIDGNQRFLGRKTLNLLNGNGDSSMMSSVLYSSIARQYLPAPKANFARVVVNGECWGVFSNVEQFNKDFLKGHFDSSEGTRWKVSGSPRGDGGLRYLGDEVEEYRSRFSIKSKDTPEAWTALIELCRVLNETPVDELEAALESILDVDGVLWFLALDVALVNSDGYWTRASDYSLYLDSAGMFHVVPHDMNEALREGHGRGGPGGPGGPRRGNGPGGPPGADGRGAGDLEEGGSDEDRERRVRRERMAEAGGGRGPGGAGGPGGGGAEQGGRGTSLDPLIGLEDDSKPLRSRLLAVPSIRARYLHHVRTIAEQDLSWDTMGPGLAKLRALIAPHVEADTKKRTSYEAFMSGTAPAPEGDAKSEGLHEFTNARRSFLLANDAVVPASLTARKSIRINEVMARNKSAFLDSAGRISDWIELYNPGETELSLAGMYLSDDNTDLTKWAFPEGATVAAGGYQIVWADGSKEADDASGAWHANFKLAKSGEPLYLTYQATDAAPVIVNGLRLGGQGKDEAYGRDPQHPHRWVRLVPTPGAKNQIRE